MELYTVRTDTVAQLPQVLLQKHLPQRCARAETFRREEDRLRCLGAGLLLRAVLGAEEAAIRYGEYGKPYLPGGPAFSLSHGGSFAALAVDDGPVGVDLEPLDAARLRMAPSLLTREELGWMRQGDETERFFALWTLKESAVKATGRGISGSLRSIQVLPVEPGRAHIRDGAAWYADWLRYENCVLAVTAAHPFEMPQVREMSKNRLQMRLEG